MQNRNAELKKCPFCGNAIVEYGAYIPAGSNVQYFMCYCVLCGAHGPQSIKENSKEDAARLWNRRGGH